MINIVIIFPVLPNNIIICLFLSLFVLIIIWHCRIILPYCCSFLSLLLLCTFWSLLFLCTVISSVFLLDFSSYLYVVIHSWQGPALDGSMNVIARHACKSTCKMYRTVWDASSFKYCTSTIKKNPQWWGN